MAGRRTSGGRAEHSSEDEAFFQARAKRSVAESGSTTSTGKRSTRRPPPTLETRRTVRLLTLRGLAPTEAANLTAYLCGIPVADSGWDLRAINRLLFLRDLNRRGRFGQADGRPANRPAT